MATSVLPTPSTGEIVQSAPPAPVAEPTVTPSTPAAPVTEVPPQELARQELYKKYYGSQDPEPAPAAPVVPETPAAPVVPEPVAAPAPAPPSDISLLMAELNAIKAQLAASAPAPVAPVVPEPTPIEQYAWAEKLQKGDLAGYEEEMAKSIQKRIGQQIESSAVERALDIRRVEDDIERFTEKIKTDNPELNNPTMTRLITSAVDRRLSEAQARNEFKDPRSYAEIFKKVLTEETQEARTFIQSLRGAATPVVAQPVPAVHNPAVTREIISGAGVMPAAIPAPGQNAASGLPPAPTNQDYFAQRLAASQRGKLLS